MDRHGALDVVAKRRMGCLLSAAFLGLVLLIGPSAAAAPRTTTATSGMNRPPEFDFKPSCQATINQDVESYPSCSADETTARDQLSKEWPQFSGSDRSMCTDLTRSFDPSYVELLSCLEMMRDGKAGGGN
jgi:hypothetical protein